MKLRKPLKMSIQARLNLATRLSVLSFAVILLVLLFSFHLVRTDIADLIDQQLKQTTENSQVSREMGDFLARLKLLEVSFYQDDAYLQSEGQALLEMLDHSSHLQHSGTLEDIQQPLKEQLRRFLLQCASVNRQLLWQSWLAEDIADTFLLADEVFAEPLFMESLQDEDPRKYDQLFSGYKIKTLEVARLIAEADHGEVFFAGFYDATPITSKLESLRRQVQKLTNSIEPIRRLSRHLDAQLEYFMHLQFRYQQEMIHLGRQTNELNAILDQVLDEIESNVLLNAVAANEVTDKIDRTIIGVGLVVLALLLTLAVFLGLIHGKLFNLHIKKPMETIRQRLLAFRQGDYDSPMPLDRDDEWGQIEEVFNDMLADLVKSWSAMQESEQRYRDIFESATEGIFQSTLNGQFLNINPAMAQILGVEATQEQIAGLNNLREQIYANPAERDLLIEKLQQEENISAFETELLRNDGRRFWASINCHLIRDDSGQVQFIEGTVNDISQRKQAEQSFLEVQAYLRNIVDSMPSVMIGINKALEVILWNRRAEEVTGFSSAEAEGQPIAEVFKPILSDRYLPQIESCLQTGEPDRLRKVEGEWLGEKLYFDLLIYPLLTDQVSSLMLHVDDVSDRIKIEDVMVQSEKMLSIGGLAAGMAHEINNPLAAVLQNAQVLTRRISPTLEKNRQVAEDLGMTIEQIEKYARERGLQKMIESITTAGQRAARIVENMLSFSRSSTSNFIPCSLSDLIEKTLELAASDYDMKHRFDFRTINIVRDYKAVPDVACEASQIQQALLSLLKNAAQAFGQEVANPEIRLRVFPKDEQVCLVVEDNGTGMSDVIRKRIFEPFYTTKEVGVGTGLGLSVAYFIITKNHQGRLSVTSEEGVGSCFTIQLPIKTNRVGTA